MPDGEKVLNSNNSWDVASFAGKEGHKEQPDIQNAEKCLTLAPFFLLNVTGGTSLYSKSAPKALTQIPWCPRPFFSCDSRIRHKEYSLIFFTRTIVSTETSRKARRN